MKASHRKDVIIARVIFAAICVFIIAGIAAIVVAIASKGDKTKQTNGETQSIQKEDDLESSIIPQPSTEDVVDPVTYVKTTSGVNMREKADKAATIITVVPEGTEVEFISEDNGWTEVVYQGQTGYISSDYIEMISDDSSDSAEQEEQQEQISTGRVVVIDPGHQAKGDSTTEPNGPGSSSMKARVKSGTSGTTTGVAEYELTLDVSLQLRDELQARGYTVYMTREKHDVNISNKERALYATEVGADIAVRIHANGSDSSASSGALALCPSSSNPYVSGLAAESSALSKYVLDAYCSETGMKNQGVQTSDTMTGMNWSEVPVTIIELGFMTNPTDDTNMQNSDYQKKMVKGIANGIDAYYASR